MSKTKAQLKKDGARALRAAKAAPVLKTGAQRREHITGTAKYSAQIEEAILMWLEKGYSLGKAADEAGINRATLYCWRKERPEFDERVKEALERGTDLYEDEMKRRAIDGVERTIFQRGEAVGTETVYSDGLLSMALTGRRPERWGKNRTEITGKDGAPIQHNVEIEFVASKGTRK